MYTNLSNIISIIAKAKLNLIAFGDTNFQKQIAVIVHNMSY